MFDQPKVRKLYSAMAAAGTESSSKKKNDIVFNMQSFIYMMISVAKNFSNEELNNFILFQDKIMPYFMFITNNLEFNMRDFENAIVPQVQQESDDNNTNSEKNIEEVSFFYQDDDDKCTNETKLNEYAETFTKIMYNLFEEFERYSNITFNFGKEELKHFIYSYRKFINKTTDFTKCNEVKIRKRKNNNNDNNNKPLLNNIAYLMLNKPLDQLVLNENNYYILDMFKFNVSLKDIYKRFKEIESSIVLPECTFIPPPKNDEQNIKPTTMMMIKLGIPDEKRYFLYIDRNVCLVNHEDKYKWVPPSGTLGKAIDKDFKINTLLKSLKINSDEDYYIFECYSKRIVDIVKSNKQCLPENYSERRNMISLLDMDVFKWAPFINNNDECKETHLQIPATGFGKRYLSRNFYCTGIVGIGKRGLLACFRGDDKKLIFKNRIAINSINSIFNISLVPGSYVKNFSKDLTILVGNETYSFQNDIQLDGYPIYLFEKVMTYEYNDSKIGKAIIDQEITHNDNYVPTLQNKDQNIMENAIEMGKKNPQLFLNLLKNSPLYSYVTDSINLDENNIQDLVSNI